MIDTFFADQLWNFPTLLHLIDYIIQVTESKYSVPNDLLYDGAVCANMPCFYRVGPIII